MALFVCNILHIQQQSYNHGRQSAGKNGKHRTYQKILCKFFIIQFAEAGQRFQGNNDGNCPDPAGPDYDFGQGPSLFKTTHDGKKVELLGAGQKSGIYWALDPDTGEIVWSTQVGPGGLTGGLQWGSATDGEQIYTAVSNSGYQPHTMLTGPNAGTIVKGGF